MADRPILFSAPMVRALLAGTKTQTRRTIKPQPSYIESSGRWHWPIPKAKQHGCDAVVTASREWHEYLLPHQRPWHASGDRLWVKERGWISKSKQAFQPYVGNEDAGTPNSPDGSPYKVCVSIHMPRWASRITLTVTDVKVERLQDISHEDAIAEGIVQLDRKAWIGGGPLYGLHEGEGHDTATGAYNRLWRDINGDGSWAANPWIVAYSFSVQHGNIDQIAKVAA